MSYVQCTYICGFQKLMQSYVLNVCPDSVGSYWFFCRFSYWISRFKHFMYFKHSPIQWAKLFLRPTRPWTLSLQRSAHSHRFWKNRIGRSQSRNSGRRTRTSCWPKPEGLRSVEPLAPVPSFADRSGWVLNMGFY